ncbi:class I SAM-dependent methyltransferase [Sphingomonas sp. Leaf25]|uniref:class I SAM-dependent methyltransferase n=1 Tax=Sphingomonas sp. Leaf25 TaxID=1735692 RepID=UPI0006FE78AE|nr:class I SAM-dependent methyltransferase [Sphingomonas sp. Leaf25]KQN07185.1 methyltransferase [Sphingomonas sp. Leaf25]
MTGDPSLGWEAVAPDFAAVRSGVGAEIVRRWSRHLPPGGSVLDIGCGTGMPVATTLADAGFALYGIDPSPTMLARFRAQVCHADAACEAVQDSRFFDRRFDGIVMIGVLFLLPEAAQQAAIHRIGRALLPGGRLLFTAPRMACRWTDSLTGQPSQSLGEARYRALLADAGCCLTDIVRDAGGNDYVDAVAG